MKSTLRLLSLISLALFSTVAWATPITTVMKMQERLPIESLAEDVQNPQSPRFQKFYSLEEIKDLCAPIDAEYKKLISQLKREGFKIVQESPTHLWIVVQGEPNVFDKNFKTNIRKLGNSFFKNLSEARFDSHHLIEKISGLTYTKEARHHFLRSQTITSAATTARSLNLNQTQIKQAYHFDEVYKSGIDGSGQDIAIATYQGFKIDNVRYFYKASGLNPLPTVDEVSFNGVANYLEDAAQETEMDAEFAGMIAPGAKVHVFTSALNTQAGELSLFNAILDDNRAKVVNYSWTNCEINEPPDHIADMQKIFARAIAQGVNIFVASGDNGSDACGNKSMSVGFPASSPDVVAVGGTSVIAGPDGEFVETAWSGSGGGISRLFTLPIWQSQLDKIFSKRSVPDVAFDADIADGQIAWTSDKGKLGWIMVGGTSIAAPQWVGFMALVENARQKKGKNSLGQLNPYLYAMTAQERSQNFNDIISGDNGDFFAGDGWDAVTGWGSMNAAALLNFLVSK